MSFSLISINAGNAGEEIYETPKILNTYGMPGSIDTPTAEVFPEGQFSVSSSISVFILILTSMLIHLHKRIIVFILFFNSL